MVFNVILESGPNQLQEKHFVVLFYKINQVGFAFNIACELGPRVSMVLTYQAR
jgi:hypothetical protein